MNIIYDLSIPGWANEKQLKEIERLAKLVPRNGRIVEVGAYLGRSSYAWAKSCHPTVKVYCIDHWSGWTLDKKNFNESIVPPIGWTPNLACTIELFKKYTKTCKNIVPIRAYSPYIKWENGLVDLVYIDDGHEYENTKANIDFWYKKIKKGGILCGDDYSPYWSGVIKAVDEIARELNVKSEHNVEFFWQFVKN